MLSTIRAESTIVIAIMVIAPPQESFSAAFCAFSAWVILRAVVLSSTAAVSALLSQSGLETSNCPSAVKQPLRWPAAAQQTASAGAECPDMKTVLIAAVNKTFLNIL